MKRFKKTLDYADGETQSCPALQRAGFVSPVVG